MSNEIGFSGSSTSLFALGSSTSYVDIAASNTLAVGDVVTSLQTFIDPAWTSTDNVARLFLLRDNGVSGSFPVYEVVGYGDISEPLAGSALSGGNNGRWRSVAVNIPITTAGTYRIAIYSSAGSWGCGRNGTTAGQFGRGGAIPTSGNWTNTDNYSGNTGRLLLAGDVVASGPPLPNITSISDTTPSHGATITITGTAFGATQGQVSFTSSITSWSDTSIVAVFDRGNTANGESVDIIVGDASDNFSDPYAVTVQPPVGWQYVVVGASLVPVDDRPSGTPTDIVTGNQLEWNNSDVTIRDDLSAYLGDGILPPQTIPYRIHDGIGWGTIGTLTISTSGSSGITSIPARSTSLVTKYTAVSNSIN